MKLSIAIATCILILNLVVQAQNSNQSKNELFKKSAITLMPEGEPDDIKEFSSLSPTIVAWGIDPIHYAMDNNKLKNHFSEYKKIGIESLACNVWMLTATDRYMFQNPELQDAVCKDIEGNKIVPGWLDSEYRGIKPWWGCTNHPKFRELVKLRAASGIKNGANLLHLDDHMGTAAAANHSGGCFCNYCLSGFQNWLKENYTEKQLKKLGISEIESFDYKRLLEISGYNTIEKYKAAIQKNQLPLRDEFMAFQLFEAAEFVNELNQLVDSVSGQNIPLGVNSWNLDPTQLATSHYADYFSNEVSHYNLEDENPPFVYMLADALQKPVFSTGTGEDWIHINHNPQPTRINRWIATAYAFGHYFMYSYNKWGFSEETGTQWYQIPIEFYEPYCSFINENQSLFDDFEPLTQVGILYENEVCRSGNWEIKEICKTFNYNNIPFGLAASGDSWMKYDLSLNALGKFDYLILPQETNLSNQEKKILEIFKNKGGRVINWSNTTDIKSQIPQLISVNKTSGIWTLPKVNSSSKDNQKKLVIQLLNQDYEAREDKMNGKWNFEIELADQLVEEFKFSKVTLYSPDEEPINIDVSNSSNGKLLTIPYLNVWGILQFD